MENNKKIRKLANHYTGWKPVPPKAKKGDPPGRPYFLHGVGRGGRGIFS